MYYKSYLPSVRAWGIFKTMPGEREDRCIVSNVEEIDCDRLLAELGAIIELPMPGDTIIEKRKLVKGASRYRLTMFKDGWAIFLDSQELPGGTLMIRSKMLTVEMVNLLTALKKADLPEGWEF